MLQVAIHLLEARKDWPVIVTAVECPTCNAGKGEFCKQVASALGGFGQQGTRSDFHAARKYAAAEFLEANPLPTPSSPVPIALYAPVIESISAGPIPQFETDAAASVIKQAENMTGIAHDLPNSPHQNRKRKPRDKKNTPTSE